MYRAIAPGTFLAGQYMSSKKQKFPEYVMLAKSSCALVRHQEHKNSCVYYRDAGNWYLTAAYKLSQLVVSNCVNDNLIDVPLITITEALYKEDNAGYV